MSDVGLDEHVGRVLGQRYRLVSPVGTGASARVYLAEDTTLRRRVAVKLLHQALASDPKFRKRFRAEAHSSAQLSHPNIMAVYDWNEPGEGPASAPAYLVTELLTGGSLRAMLDAGNQLSLSQALIVGLHASEGLSYAHHNGFVHRDIKPANLLFGSEGRLRIADFGIARAVAEAAWTEPEGSLVGTARYAAPEQAAGATIDGRADVYGLAVTLIEAVTGTVPLSAPTPLATMVLRQDKDLPVPAELGPLRSALELAGKAKVDERCTAEEFAAALRSAAASLPRPKKLPLPGLERDPRAGGARTARVSPPAFEDETGILVLKDNDASIDLSSGADDVRVVEDVSPKPVAPSPRSQPVGPVAEFEPLDDELEDSRRRWPILLLLLVLGAGAFVAYNGRDGQVAAEPEGVAAAAPRVENYVGLTYDEAVEAVERNGWVAIPADGRADGTTPGDVIEQSPGVGADLAEGMEITIVISEGQILRIAPEVVGLARADALAELADAGLFMGDTGEEFHETAPVGEIVFASVPAGTSVETGTAVDLIWSLGPAPREIPGLAGSLLVDAQLALDELGLTYVVVENYSQTVPEGEIISTDPAVGVVLDRGAEVTLVVSLGLPFIEVPNVSGMVAAEAADVLTAAGFVVVDTVGPPNGEVLATDPPAGELIRQGSSIVIFVRGSGG